MDKKERPSWDKTFMDICKTLSLRSTCLSRDVGAVAVINNRIVATGYNGAPSGAIHCNQCIRRELNVPSGQRHELCRGVHAEMNTIIQSALNGGTSLTGMTLYCTHQPCSICMKMLVSLKTKRIVFENEYPDEETMKIATEHGMYKIYYSSEKLWGFECK